jgi:hypothetical protein
MNDIRRHIVAVRGLWRLTRSCDQEFSLEAFWHPHRQLALRTGLRVLVSSKILQNEKVNINAQGSTEYTVNDYCVQHRGDDSISGHYWPWLSQRQLKG